MAFTTFTLPCGLRVLHQDSPTQVAYCGFAVNCGTRDELPTESGMAHFVEHLLFKGTEHRKAWHILNRMESVGGDLNAFTNKENTVIYASFMAEHFQRAAELLTDIVFCSTFPQKEMDKEVEVVCDEIESYQDEPSELIWDDWEDLVFHGHELGRNILGDPQALRSYRSQDVLRFHRRFYQPQNMVFFIRGNVPVEKVRTTLESLTSGMNVIPDWTRPVRSPLPDYMPQTLTQHRDTHQAHVMLGTRSYPAGNPKRTCLYLLNNILGGPGMNARLNVSLRERRGLVYNVESNSQAYTDTGHFSIYFGCDIEDVPTCLKLCHEELDRLVQKPLTSTQLHAALKQIKGQIGVSCDNFEKTILDLALEFLHYNTVETPQELYARLDTLTPERLLETAQELFGREHLSLLEYV